MNRLQGIDEQAIVRQLPNVSSPDGAKGGLSGTRRALTTFALVRSLVALPFVTLKIVGAIHWEALRLWLKGVRLVPRADTATANACNSGLASAESHAYIVPALTARRGALGSSEGR